MQLGKNFWKFNSSLINDEKYVTQMKQHINEVKCQFNSAFGKKKAHLQWEFSKCEVWKFSIEFSKLKREKLSCLEAKLKELEQNLRDDEAKEQYNACRG